MSGMLDVRLQDETTSEEIRLVTELMVVASMAPGDLEQQVIDGALGLNAGQDAFPSQRRSD